MRAKTNSPIFGILTQPVPSDWTDYKEDSFVESSNIEFLQAAGARVIHLDYRMSQKELKKELEQLNGVYIPGDTKVAYLDGEFINTVGNILNWAEKHNNHESQHFPVVGVSWGMMSMLKSQMRDTSKLVDLPEWMAGEALQQNLNLTPFETFTYDEMTPMGLENLLDKIDFYNELDVGLALRDFNVNRGMRAFVPVATWDSDTTSTSRFDEYVSMIEGHYHPFFGFGYRLDKVQFGFHTTGTDGHSKVDHHKKSIQHAQKIANLIVDEARLSENRYKWTNDETDRLIKNHDVHFVDLPSPHSFIETKNYDSTYRTELYLFQ